jgi:hypothetical protein
MPAAVDQVMLLTAENAVYIIYEINIPMLLQVNNVRCPRRSTRKAAEKAAAKLKIWTYISGSR